MALPGCMALEQVSPVNKFSQAAKGVVISADGERVRFQSVAPLGDTTGVHVGLGDRYVASRGPAGWGVAAAAPVPTEITEGWNGEPYSLSFDPSLSSWFVLGASSQQGQQGQGQAFSGALGGIFQPISPLLAPLGGGTIENLTGSKFLGASGDHSSLVFWPGGAGGSSTVGYLLGDPKPEPANLADPNAYLARLDSNGQPTLALLGRDRDGKVWGGNCGARLGGIDKAGGSPAPNGQRGQGAISYDGSRAFFSARISQPATGACSTTNKLRILERLESEQGPWIGQLFASECTRPASPTPCSAADGDDLYQGASDDGGKVYFTTTRQLTNSDLDVPAAECSGTSAVPGCDLYLYEAGQPPGQRLTQVSAGAVTAGHPTVGSGAKVLSGTTAISADGSHAYFVAEGALTGENAEHKSPSSAVGARNLYVYERDASHSAGQLSFVASLAAGDAGALWGGEGGTWRNAAYPVPALSTGAGGDELGGDGHILLFQTKAELTAVDVDGSRTDTYRYDAGTGALLCITCKPGGPDGAAIDVQRNGESSAPGTDVNEEGRWVSEDGENVVFKTAEGLLPTDENGEADYYLWRSGQLYRLPGRAYTPGAAFSGNLGGEVLTISPSGSEVGFVSAVPLLAGDGDAAADVYVIRIDGGYPTPPLAPVCHGEGCQEPFAAQPAEGGGGSESATGTNVTPVPGCPKGRVRRQGKCVRPHRKHGKHRKHSKHRHGKRAHNGRAGGLK